MITSGRSKNMIDVKLIIICPLTLQFVLPTLTYYSGHKLVGFV